MASSNHLVHLFVLVKSCFEKLSDVVTNDKVIKVVWTKPRRNRISMLLKPPQSDLELAESIAPPESRNIAESITAAEVY